MRSSKWHALGNVYLLVEQAELSADEVRAEAQGTDGIVQVVAMARAPERGRQARHPVAHEADLVSGHPVA